jgi:ATP-dependent Zn protease
MLTDRRRRSIAIHEAGHAVASIASRRRFRHVTIKPDEDSLGHVQLIPPLGDVDMKKSFDFLVCALAGFEAERAFGFKGLGKQRYEADRAAAVEHAVDMSGHPQEVRHWIRLAEMRSKTLVEAWRASIETIADRLLIETSLDWETARSIAHEARGMRPC